MVPFFVGTVYFGTVCFWYRVFVGTVLFWYQGYLVPFFVGPGFVGPGFSVRVLLVRVLLGRFCFGILPLIKVPIVNEFVAIKRIFSCFPATDSGLLRKPVV